MTFSLNMNGPVAVLTWDEGQNRINVDSLAALNAKLDEIERTEGPLAVVVAGVAKFFCNGMDLDRFAARSPEFMTTVDAMNLTIGRLMVFPAYSVAAINGHAFAAGAMLTFGFDYRIMREDRGYWCLNEAELGIELNEQAFSTVSHRLTHLNAAEAVITARRYSALEALEAGIVDSVAPESDLLGRAIEIAERCSHLDRETLAAHKRRINGVQAKRLGFKF